MNGFATIDAPATPLADALELRAASCLRQVMELARGPGGLLISHVRFDTRLPLQEGEDHPPILNQVLDSVWGPASPRPTVAEWYYGENTCWATGWLMWSQMTRYRVTGDAEALTVARKCFRDLNHLFDICGTTFEPGLLGKPHGGRAGNTTSFDQSAIPVLPYCQFAREFGTEQEKAIARENMRAHGDFYLRRDWVMNHHGNLVRIVEPGHASSMKYLACVHAAYDMTGETRFRDAAETHVRQLVAGGQIPWPKPVYELNANLFYYAYLGEYWSSTRLADAADWIGNIGVYWKAAQAGLDDEGLLLDGLYDTQTGRFTPTAEGWSDKFPPSAGDRPAGRWWRSSTGYQGRTLYTLLVAMLGLLARKHGLDTDAHQVSRRILERVGDDGFRQCWDDGRLPPEMHVYTNLFGAEFAAQWMLAYWMGRALGAW